MTEYQTKIWLIVFGAIFSLLIFKYGSFGSRESTRSELRMLYGTGFNHCKIENVISRDYPGKGKYHLFKTSCNKGYFPILLHKMSYKDKISFKNGAMIKKERNTYQFQLILDDKEGKKIHNGLFRSMEEEKDDLLFKFFMPLILGFFLSGCLILVLNWSLGLTTKKGN